MTRNLALVTGGAQRLGKAFALSLARMGYDILLHYHSSEEEAQCTKAEIEALGRTVHLLQADLSNPEEIHDLFSQVDSIFHLSSFIFRVLVNSASVMPVGHPRELPLEDWNAAFDLNLRAVPVGAGSREDDD
jgi:NAD(P)-dependent dehydrogenase (short-subunit alcohol dehydrogenase family)